jgi:hypothetical protein
LAWFVALVALFGVGLALAFTLAGPPLLGFTIRALTWGAYLERRRPAILTGETLADPARPLPTGSPAPRLREASRDPAVRRDLRSLVALTPIGLVQVAVGLLAPASIALVAMPAYFWLPSRLLGPGV